MTPGKRNNSKNPALREKVEGKEEKTRKGAEKEEEEEKERSRGKPGELRSRKTEVREN